MSNPMIAYVHAQIRTEHVRNAVVVRYFWTHLLGDRSPNLCPEDVMSCARNTEYQQHQEAGMLLLWRLIPFWSAV
jgi:hypothetical protein